MVILAGCGSSPAESQDGDTPQGAGRTTTSAPAPSTTAPAPAAGPTSLVIPAIGVNAAPLVGLGLTGTREHEVPPVEQPEIAGWYEPGPEPGQTGPSIILGHVNGAGRPGVFAQLHTLEPGDEVRVDQHVFEVTEVQRADKVAFPADRVYAETAEPELRLITCGGAFDSASGDYLDNIIVYAELASRS
ncbi:class F sortase [Blastococcus sp. SYSU D01042]